MKHLETAAVAIPLLLAAATLVTSLTTGWPHLDVPTGLAMGAVFLQSAIALARRQFRPPLSRGPFPLPQAGLAIAALAFIALITVGDTATVVAAAAILLMGAGLGIAMFGFFLSARKPDSQNRASPPGLDNPPP